MGLAGMVWCAMVWCVVGLGWVRGQWSRVCDLNENLSDHLTESGKISFCLAKIS